MKSKTKQKRRPRGLGQERVNRQPCFPVHTRLRHLASTPQAQSPAQTATVAWPRTTGPGGGLGALSSGRVPADRHTTGPPSWSRPHPGPIWEPPWPPRSHSVLRATHRNSVVGPPSGHVAQVLAQRRCRAAPRIPQPQGAWLPPPAAAPVQSLRPFLRGNLAVGWSASEQKGPRGVRTRL